MSQMQTETVVTVSEPQRPVAPELPLDVAVLLLGTKWAEPLNELRPRH